MSVFSWLIIILLVIFIINRFMPTKGVKNITVQEAKDKLKDKQIQLIDVRTPGEYKSNHVKRFKNIPLAVLLKKINELDKGKETVVICQSGMRSARAAKKLKKQGFNQIYNVKGGMNAWY